jgi:preprotein translocase subunit SecG
MITFFFWLVMVLFIFVCFLLMMLVLIQKGRGGGLASAFGGGGGHTPFGTKTGDVLTWATSILFGVFILLAIALNRLSNAVQENIDNEKGKTQKVMVMPADNEREHLG